MSVHIPFDSSPEHYTLYSPSMQELFVEPLVFLFIIVSEAKKCIRDKKIIMNFLLFITIYHPYGLTNCT